MTTNILSHVVAAADDLARTGGNQFGMWVQWWEPQINSRLDAVFEGLAGWWASADALTAAAVLGLGVGTGLAAALLFNAALNARRRYHGVGEAVWLQISPPAQLPGDGGLALWRMLAGCLRRTRGGLFSALWSPPASLALEWWAGPSGVRPGVWVPPRVRPDEVADAIRRAWPGAAVAHTLPPVWHVPPPGYLELAPARGRWAPLLDTARVARPTVNAGGGEEPLRAVLAALATRAPAEQACVQLVITAHHGPLDAALAGLFSHTSGRAGGSGRGGKLIGLLRAVTPSLLGTIAGSVALVVLGLLDLLVPGPSSLRRPRTKTATPTGTSDLATVAARKAIEAKRGNSPHLDATLRIAVNTRAGTHPLAGRARRIHISAARRIASDIAAGFDLVTTSTPLRGRWATHSDSLTLRSPAGGGTGGFVATLAELAALWHLPAEPGRYRLPDPATAQRRPGLPLPRAQTNPTARRTAGPRPPHAAGPGIGQRPARRPGTDPRRASEPGGERAARVRPPGHPNTGRPPSMPTHPSRSARDPHRHR